jgi:hypothetical protein
MWGSNTQARRSRWSARKDSGEQAPPASCRSLDPSVCRSALPSMRTPARVPRRHHYVVGRFARLGVNAGSCRSILTRVVDARPSQRCVGAHSTARDLVDPHLPRCECRVVPLDVDPVHGVVASRVSRSPTRSSAVVGSARRRRAIGAMAMRGDRIDRTLRAPSARLVGRGMVGDRVCTLL